MSRNAGLPNLGCIAEDHGYSAPSGYVVLWSILCPECAAGVTIDGIPVDLDRDPEIHAICSHDETDSPDFCEECGILIPTSLTSYGVEYVRSVDGRSREGRLYREAFYWAFGLYGPAYRWLNQPRRDPLSGRFVKKGGR